MTELGMRGLTPRRGQTPTTPPTRAIVVAGALLLASCGGAGGDGYAERMAAEHAGDRPVASAAATAAAVGAVRTERVTYATLDGEPVTGYLAYPPAGTENAPGILVIQEWWGLNDNIRAMAERLAGEGYVALAVDLYRGQVAEDPERARELMQQAAGREAELEDNLRQAHTYLVGRIGSSRVGVVGWCFGGAWSLRAALALDDGIAATVVYYGRLVTDRDALARLRSPVLGHFGSEDGGIPLDSVRAFETLLGELEKQVEIHVYEGADHAFANPSGTRYDAAAADLAWTRTLDFFERHLSPS